jgi:hypothetical protein
MQSTSSKTNGATAVGIPQSTSENKQRIAGKPRPFESIDPRQIEKVQTPRIPVARIYSVMELDNAERKKIDKRHLR